MKIYCIFNEISQIIIGNDYENWCCFRLFLNIFGMLSTRIFWGRYIRHLFFSENSGIFSDENLLKSL